MAKGMSAAWGPVASLIRLSPRYSSRVMMPLGISPLLMNSWKETTCSGCAVLNWYLVALDELGG